MNILIFLNVVVISIDMYADHRYGICIWKINFQIPDRGEDKLGPAPIRILSSKLDVSNPLERIEHNKGLSKVVLFHCYLSNRILKEVFLLNKFSHSYPTIIHTYKQNKYLATYTQRKYNATDSLGFIRTIVIASKKKTTLLCWVAAFKFNTDNHD